MPAPGPHSGSGDACSDSTSDRDIRFSVPLASVAKSTQKLHVSNIPPNMEESGKLLNLEKHLLLSEGQLFLNIMFHCRSIMY